MLQCRIGAQMLFQGLQGKILSSNVRYLKGQKNMVLSELVYFFDDSDVRLGNLPGVRQGLEGFQWIEFDIEDKHAHGFFLKKDLWYINNLITMSGVDAGEIYIDIVDSKFMKKAEENEAFKADVLKLMPDLTSAEALIDLVNNYGWMLNKIELSVSDDEIIEWASGEELPGIIQEHFSHLFEPCYE